MTLFAIRTFLAGIPWQVYGIAVLAVVAMSAWGWHRSEVREAYEEGREGVLSELRSKEAQAKEKAVSAILAGDEAAAKRAEVEAATAGELLRGVEEAEAEGGNALDAIF